MLRKTLLALALSTVLAVPISAQETVIAGSGVGEPYSFGFAGTSTVGQTFTTPVAARYLTRMSLWVSFYGVYPSWFEWTLWKFNSSTGSLETIVERDTARVDSGGPKDIDVEIEVLPLELYSVSISAVNFQGYWAGWINGTYDGGRYWSAPSAPSPGFVPEDWNQGFDLQFEMTVSTVPEPAAVWLLATGLLGLGGAAVGCRRKRQI